jgi:hypothetical protein
VRWEIHSAGPDEVRIFEKSNPASMVTLSDKKGGGWLQRAFERFDGRTAVETVLQDVPPQEQTEFRRLVGGLHGKCFVDARGRIGPASALAAENIRAGQLAECAFRTISLEAAHIVVLGEGHLASAVHRLLNRVRRRRTRRATFASAATSMSGQAMNDREQWEPGMVARSGTGRSASATVLNPDACDMLIIASDFPDPEFQSLASAWCWRHSIRCVMAELAGAELRAGPCLVPAVTGCYDCFRAGHRLITGDAPADGVAPNPAHVELLAAIVVSDIANLVGEVPRALQRDQSLLLGQQVTVDLRSYAVEARVVLKKGHCTRCGFGRRAEQLTMHQHPEGQIT